MTTSCFPYSSPPQVATAKPSTHHAAYSASWGQKEDKGAVGRRPLAPAGALFLKPRSLPWLIRLLPDMTTHEATSPSSGEGIATFEPRV